MGPRSQMVGMHTSNRLIRRIGTFDGKAGCLDRFGQMSLAESKVDLRVSDRWEDEVTGEELTELTLVAELPANQIEMRVTVPEHGGERLVELFSDDP